MTNIPATAKYYVASNKSDDYGNCLTELVCTTPKHANEYYWSIEIESPEHVQVLQRYLETIEYEEEIQRSKDERYYGVVDA